MNHQQWGEKGGDQGRQISACVLWSILFVPAQEYYYFLAEQVQILVKAISGHGDG